jgi:hypothetical protein
MTHSPNKIVLTSRSVIEGKLLSALSEKGTVAILLSKQDCDDLHAALCGYTLGTWKGNTLSWQEWVKRCDNLAEGIDQLRKEAFPQ